MLPDCPPGAGGLPPPQVGVSCAASADGAATLLTFAVSVSHDEKVQETRYRGSV